MRIGGLALLALLAGCQQQSKPPAKPPEINFDGARAIGAAAQLAHGERLTHALGCRGCHGEKLGGHRFYEAYASNLTRDVSTYNDAEIERVLRTGVPHDGRDLWGMPSEIFQHLSAADMAALIVYLRTLKPSGPPDQPLLPFGKEARELIAKGELKPAAVFVREEGKKAPADVGPQYALGRYITMVTCAECHGPELNGDEGFSPNLVVAGGYTREEFETLLTKGIPSGGRKLKNELMSEVAKERFSHFTPHERDALYAYLKARAERPQ